MKSPSPCPENDDTKVPVQAQIHSDNPDTEEDQATDDPETTEIVDPEEKDENEKKDEPIAEPEQEQELKVDQESKEQGKEEEKEPDSELKEEHKEEQKEENQKPKPTFTTPSLITQRKQIKSLKNSLKSSQEELDHSKILFEGYKTFLVDLRSKTEIDEKILKYRDRIGLLETISEGKRSLPEGGNLLKKIGELFLWGAEKNF